MKNKMQIQEVDVKAERRKRRRGIVLLSTASVLVLGGGTALAWYLTPPALPTTIAEAKTVVDSPRFQRLSKADKQPYYDVIREQFGSLNREERHALVADDESMRQAMRASGEQMMQKMARQYVLATPQERAAMQANFQAMRPRGPRPEGDAGKPAGAPGAGGPGGGGAGADHAGPPGGRDPGAMRDHIGDRMANGDSQMNQFFGEMMRQMHEQREKNAGAK